MIKVHNGRTCAAHLGGYDIINDMTNMSLVTSFRYFDDLF